MRVFTRDGPFRLFFQYDGKIENRRQNRQWGQNGYLDVLISLKLFFEWSVLLMLWAALLGGVMIFTQITTLHATDLRTEDGEQHEHDKEAWHGAEAILKRSGRPVR